LAKTYATGDPMGMGVRGAVLVLTRCEIS